ncbi:MAG: hypothetical protein WCF12_09760, partial [Propionicimonas sp.]
MGREEGQLEQPGLAAGDVRQAGGLQQSVGAPRIGDFDAVEVEREIFGGRRGLDVAEHALDAGRIDALRLRKVVRLRPLEGLRQPRIQLEG